MKRSRASLFALPLLLTALHAFGFSAAAQVPAPEAYRNHALTKEGDAARGAKLFHGQVKLLCSNCHSVDGSASKAGPDLFAGGDALGRRNLIDAILLPSDTIAPGYGAIIVEKKTGEAFHGVLKQRTEAGLQLMGADGALISVAAGDIEEEAGSTVSLMPEGLHASLSLQEFTDLVEYLTTLRQPESTLVADHGMPAVIPLLGKPIKVSPFFSGGDFKLPRSRAETGLTAFHQLPGRPEVFFVLHQKGTIWRVEKTAGGEERSVFLDLTLEVFSARGPNGLLDMAFHPEFRENRKYYLFYQVFEESKVTTHIVERRMDESFRGDSGMPPRLILKIASVAEDHSGGCLHFGSDGFLYLTMGDTGPHHDPNGHAQNLQLLLGKILRIDVNREEAAKAYAIPQDNPFSNRPNARPEIWAYGFRNPWRFSFDRLNGDLWVADVGQDRVEEVALVRRGENHGWNAYEGFEPFSTEFRQESRTYTPPVFSYRRKYGNSITGGHVYRGDKRSSFYGVYLCGDYTSKRIFGFAAEKGRLKIARQIGTLPQRIASFSEDEAGNLYAVGYEGGIYQIHFSDAFFE
ncbi:MAG TPA: PQQ-dependent sugar dehydrogenase [Chthoniobacteraceae bacterium]